MEPLQIPPTQFTEKHREILVNIHGNPLRINLQAVELEGRPKLVRMLKNSGATVVSNAKEATIILVDSTTESGKRLIRTWGHDTSKVVLEYTWARASIEAGRPLLEIDTWGGAMTVDDGRPVTIDGIVIDEDELDEVEALVTKSPLPTPRITPVDAATQRPEDVVNECRGVLKSDSIVDSNITDHSASEPPVAVSAPSEEPKVDTRNDELAPPQPAPSAPQMPHPHYPMLIQPSQSQSTYAPFATQHTYSSPQPQSMQTQPFQPLAFPSQLQIIPSPSASHTPLSSINSRTMPMASNTTPPSTNSVDLQTQNLATLMTLMEVVRQSNWFGPTQPPGPQQPPSSASSFHSAEGAELLEDSIPLPSSRNYVPSDSATSSRKHRSPVEGSENRQETPKSRICSPEEILSSSISRKRSSSVKPVMQPRKRLRKGKERAISSDHSADEIMGSSDCSLSTNSSISPPTRSRIIIARKKYGEIFVARSGQSLRFFVQVDLHGRHAVVTNIKKNKGKIVNNIADADYVILFSRSDTFQGLLNEALALEKSPILAAFVTDCVEEGALLDETDYVLESVAKAKALKWAPQNPPFDKVKTPEKSSRQIKVEKSSPPTSEGKKLRASSKLSTDKKTKLKPKTPKSTPSKSTTEEYSLSRSPTPPPATTRQIMPSGKYLFTEAEDEYFLRLARHHLNRNPSISNNALITKLYRKLPHHSLGSWAAHIDKKVKAALEDVRKRANIANRKRVSEAVNPQGFASQGNQSRAKHTSGTAERNGDVALASGYPSQAELDRQDFEVITQFFASGRGDDDDDERVWQELEQHRQCRSAHSWPEYYAARQEQVYARIEELVKERDGN